MLKLDDHFALLDFHAAGQAIFLRVLVPLIEDVQFLVGWGFEIFHAGIDGEMDGHAATHVPHWMQRSASMTPAASSQNQTLPGGSSIPFISSRSR